MRLLHIIASMDPVSGGPSQGIRTLNKAMENMGVTREVVCLDPPDSTYLGIDEFKIHAIGPAKGVWNYSSNLTKWLTINALKFDVLIINGLWLYPSYATWKVINKFKKKSQGAKLPRILVMSHGMLDPYFQRAKGRKLKAVRNWLYWKLIENRVVNDADGLLFTCETELLLARQTFSPYRPKKEYNVGYGIAPPPPYDSRMVAAFKEHCHGINDSPYLLFLSRIHPKKGTDLLIKAYTILFESTKPAGVQIPKLVIAGPGIDSDFGKMLLKELSRSTEIKDRIIFPGMLTGDIKWGAFYGCEAFILPSHQENFGIAVVEALSCSKAVLITNQVNIWREIETSGGGIVATDDLLGVKNMLSQWLTLSSEEKIQMGKKALAAYQNQFAISKIAGNFLAVFND